MDASQNRPPLCIRGLPQVPRFLECSLQAPGGQTPQGPPPGLTERIHKILFGKFSDPFVRMFRKVILYRSGLIANMWCPRLRGPPAQGWGEVKLIRRLAPISPVPILVWIALLSDPRMHSSAAAPTLSSQPCAPLAALMDARVRKQLCPPTPRQPHRTPPALIDDFWIPILIK